MAENGTNMLFTRYDLLCLLADALREWTDDMLFPAQPYDEADVLSTPIPDETGEEVEIRERKLHIYKMGLPDKEREIKEIPYLLLKYLTSSDTGETDSACFSILIAVYNENEGEGGCDVLRLIDRICFKLAETEILGGKFLLMRDKTHTLDSVVYHPDNMPYYFGEIQTFWELPEVERDLTEWRGSFHW